MIWASLKDSGTLDLLIVLHAIFVSLFWCKLARRKVSLKSSFCPYNSFEVIGKVVNLFCHIGWVHKFNQVGILNAEPLIFHIYMWGGWFDHALIETSQAFLTCEGELWTLCQPAPLFYYFSSSIISSFVSCFFPFPFLFLLLVLAYPTHCYSDLCFPSASFSLLCILHLILVHLSPCFLLYISLSISASWVKSLPSSQFISQFWTITQLLISK